MSPMAASSGGDACCQTASGEYTTTESGCCCDGGDEVQPYQRDLLLWMAPTCSNPVSSSFLPVLPQGGQVTGGFQIASPVREISHVSESPPRLYLLHSAFLI